jgi:hypothetical protein
LVALGRGRPERAALLLAAADAYRSAQASGRELGAEEALRLALG